MSRMGQVRKPISEAIVKTAQRMISRRPSGRPAVTLLKTPASSVVRSWAAGIMEGEGSIMIRKTVKKLRPQLAVSITNTDIEMLKPFETHWGGRVAFGASKNIKHKARFRWGLVSQQAAQFIRDIRPYLVTTRVKEKALLGLEFQAHKDAWRALPGMDGDHYAAKQMEYYRRMLLLNKKGPRDHEPRLSSHPR